MVDIPFLKKLKLPIPDFSFKKLVGQAGFLGIDIGISSAKVVQLRKESEKAVLETYGELKTAGYLKRAEGGAGGGFLRFSDADIASLLTDLLRESGVTTKEAVLSIPAVSSFVTLVDFPKSSKEELASAVPYEARKYIPIPISEIVLDWEMVLDEESSDKTQVLIVAVPKEVINKYKRAAELAKIKVRALEVETFSLVRSLIGHDPSVTALINLGSQSTTAAIVDKTIVRLSVNISKGSDALTTALARGLDISTDRAENFKKEVGLSQKDEEREITGILSPLVDAIFFEVERVFDAYNRRHIRKIEKIILTGGGSHLKGLVDYAAGRFGVETSKGNPFYRITHPAFMQPILKEVGPNFAVAVGLALREITPQ